MRHQRLALSLSALVLASACTGGGVRGPALSASPSEVDFGAVVLGESADLSVELSNIGTLPTGALTLELRDGDIEDFELRANACADTLLAAGRSCTFRVRFTPSARGDHDAVLVIEGEKGERLNVVLTGKGKAPPSIVLTPSSHDFGDGEVEIAGAAVDFGITNQSAAAVELMQVMVGGLASEDFIRDDDQCSGKLLKASASCTVKVRFQATESGTRNASLTVLTRSGDKAESTLTGNGVVFPPSLSFEPSGRDFGGAMLGETVARVINVENIGTRTTGELSLSITGEHAADFTITTDTCSGEQLAPEDFCTVGLQFAPAAAGPREAVFSASARPGGRVTAPLSGLGQKPPKLSFALESHDFGRVPTGARPQVSLAVRNEGDVPSGAIAHQFGGADAARFAVVTDFCSGGFLDGGESCSITVEFRPEDLETFEAHLDVSAAPGGSSRISLAGEGIRPARLVVSPGDHDFGWVEQNAPVGTSMSFSVTNEGDAATGALSLALTGSAAGHFGIDDATNCGAALEPDGSCMVVVSFRPTSAGTFEASLEIGAAPGGSVSVRLDGTGRPPTFIHPDTPEYDFGMLPEKVIGQAVEFTLTNEGQSATGALAAAIQGTGSIHFQLVSNGCSGMSIAPGGACKVSVAFTPQALGQFGAVLTVTGTPGGTAVVALEGRGVGPARLEASPLSVDFGDVATATGTTRTVVLENAGDYLTSAIALDFEGAGLPFTLVDDGCSGRSLTAGQTCTVGVRFQPAVLGSNADRLTAISPNGGSAAVDLAGRGVRPAALALLTTELDFGRVAIDELSAPRTLRMKNEGDVATGTVFLNMVGSTSVFQVEEDLCSLRALEAQEECTITLRFLPRGAGDQQVTLSLQASPGGQVSTVARGTGATPLRVGIDVTGVATGTVFVDGRQCADSCEFLFGEGAVVTFEARPGPGAKLRAWSGACSGSSPTCELTLTTDTSLAADFEHRQIELFVELDALDGASGAVKVGGTICDTSCTTVHAYGTEVTLQALPAGDQTSRVYFGGWRGRCEGEDDATCIVTLEDDLTVTAVFTPPNLAFVTAQTYPLDTLTPAQADAYCQAEIAAMGEAAPPGTTFMAWLSSPTQSAGDRLRATGARGWWRVDVPFVDTVDDLVVHTRLLTPLRLDLDGQTTLVEGVEEPVVTGTLADGTAGFTCNGWQGSGQATVGSGAHVFDRWTDAGTISCSQSARLYCLGTDYRAIQRREPPPEISWLLFVSSVPFNPSQGLAAANQLCAQDAQQAGLGDRTFIAALGDSQLTLINRMGASPTHRVDGMWWADAPGDDFSLLTPNVTASGEHLAVRVWTGTPDLMGDPPVPAESCNNWSSNASTGFVGDVTSVTEFLAHDVISCSATDVHILCFEQRDDPHPFP